MRPAWLNVDFSSKPSYPRSNRASWSHRAVVPRGCGIYREEAKFVFALTRRGQRPQSSSIPVSGPDRLTMKLGKARVVTLRWNEPEIARGSIPNLSAEQPLDGLQIGKDSDGCVGTYRSPHKYPGQIEAATIRLEE